jgi:hypothetical protein
VQKDSLNSIQKLGTQRENVHTNLFPSRKINALRHASDATFFRPSALAEKRSAFAAKFPAVQGLTFKLKRLECMIDTGTSGARCMLASLRLE